MTRRAAGFRRRALCGVVVAFALLPAAAHSADDVIEVMLDKAKVLRMPARAQTIVVGNPIVADVTTLKTDGLLVVTGKGFGETNMIFLDKAGDVIEEANVRVRAGTSHLTVQRGLARESYSCQPRCEPTVALGDEDTFLKGASGQITARNTLSTTVVSH